MGRKKTLTIPPPGFALIALSSMLSPSRLLLLIERSLGWSLSLRPAALQQLGYTVFATEVAMPAGTIALLPNALPNGGRLVRQLPKVDYLLELSGDGATAQASTALRGLQQAGEVQAAIRVEPSSIKRTLPFWME